MSLTQITILVRGNWGTTDFAGPYNPVYTGNVNDGAALAAALPVSPIIAVASAAAGTYSAGNTLTLTLYTSEAVTGQRHPHTHSQQRGDGDL